MRTAWLLAAALTVVSDAVLADDVEIKIIRPNDPCYENFACDLPPAPEYARRLSEQKLHERNVRKDLEKCKLQKDGTLFCVGSLPFYELPREPIITTKQPH